MDCKVFVIVDFDNFFPRPIPEIPINKIEFLFQEIVRDIITNVHNVQNIIIRIYGGWYQDDTLTNRASQLLSILKLISDGIFPVVIEQRKIEGSIDMVFSLFKVAHVWYNTYQERSGLPKLRIAHANVGDHCSMNKNSCPVHILSRFTRAKSKLCHVDGCLTKQDDVFIQRTQKMVDTMMACDVLSFCEEQNVGGVYIASDDIDLFPAIALGRNINNSMPLFLLVLNKKRFDYYSATLSDFNIKIRNCNE